MARLTALVVAGVGCLIAASAEEILKPEIDGAWWQVAGQPDLGQLSTEEQQPVDFGIWQAADGNWQLWSCIRKTNETGTGRLFHGWEGGSLMDANWNPLGIQMRANVAIDEVEGGLQAPHVVKIHDRFHMFYGTWKAIALALSDSGKTFQRSLNNDGMAGLFGGPKEHNRRDAMVLKHKDLWYCYYTAHPDRIGRVFCRTSKDLKTWSKEHLVRIGGAAGDNFWSHECPHVVKLGDWFYLFTTQKYLGSPRSSVYRSKNPLMFGHDDDAYLIGTLPVAAPEIILHEGKWFIASLMPQLNGVRIAKLKWIKGEE